MATPLLTTADQRLQALLQLEAAFGQVNGGMEFTYLGNVYQSIGVNGDGTLRVSNLATGEISAIDPVNIYEAALAAQGDAPPATTVNNYTKVAPPPVPLLQQIAAQAGTIVGLANFLEQSVGKWALSAKVQAENATAHMLTTHVQDGFLSLGMVQSPSGFKTWANIILSNRYFTNGLSIAGIALSSYSVFTGIQKMFDVGPTAGSAVGVAGGAFGIATSANMLLHLSMLNPIGLGIGAFVVGGSLIFTGIQNMLKNGPTAGTAGATAAGVLLTAVAASGVIALVLAHAVFADAMLALMTTATATLATSAATATAGAALTVAAAQGSFSAIMSAALTNPVGWIVAAGVIGAAFAYKGINDMVSNGISAKGVVMAAIGAFAMVLAAGLAVVAITLAIAGIAVTGFTTMALLAAALTNPIGWIIAGAVILFMVLYSVFTQPPPETQAAMSLNKALTPIIYTAGPMAMVAIGTAAALMGWPKTGGRPTMSNLTVPSYYATQILSKTNGISKIPLDAKTPSIMIEPGTATEPEKVIIVTPTGTTDGRGRPMIDIESYVLSSNLKFMSSLTTPQAAYIPIFTYNSEGKPHYSPSYLTAIENEHELLRAALSGGLTMQGSLSAVQLASAANKTGVNPDSDN